MICRLILLICIEMTVSIEESVTTAQGNVSAVIHMRSIFLNVLVHKLYIQETRNGVVLTLGSYGERCECDNSTSGACPVGTDLKLVCSGRSL